jgi:arylsulfatase A-like enzyme
VLAPRPRLDTEARRRAGGAVALLVGLSLIAAALADRGALRPASAAAPIASEGRPNVVVIETDDQTLESMKVMNRVRARIAERGVTFRNSFVNFSLCCPSRATFLTGQYAHNHGIRSNSSRTGGFPAFQRLHADDNLAVWLQAAGYRTALIGKYLNGYSAEPIVPAGWDEWHGGIGGAVYDYDLNENGTIVHYGTAPEDFKQDVLTDRALQFIGNSAVSEEPFFLWLTYSAPHTSPPDPNPQPPHDCDGAAKPAPRDAGAFTSEPLPAPPNFNEADVSDKPSGVRLLPLLTDPEVADVTRRYRCALGSLLSVDRGVDRLISALKRSGELADTYLIYTSDNGFFNGEHRIPGGKTKLYEESIRVPLLIRGPGIPRGKVTRDLAINADLAPTIVQIAQAEPSMAFDGHSLLPALRHPGRERGRELLVEASNFAAIRTQRYVYGLYASGQKELYDLVKDRYELNNVAGAPSYEGVSSALAERLEHLRDCRSAGCRLRPRVTLTLRHRSEHEDGRRCAGNPIRALITGEGVADVVEVWFGVGGLNVAVDAEVPFRKAMPAVNGWTRVRARVSMIDGRRMTLARRVRACG